MRKVQKAKFLFSLLLSIIMILSVFGSAASGAAPAGDISEFVELRMFAIMDAPLNQDMANQYFETLNAMLEEKLNCRIKVDYASGNDYQNNYQLVMSSGDQYDLIHSARWLDYQNNAIKGAFMDLTELAPQYMPDYYATVGEDKWNGVKVNGKIYGVPKNRPMYAEPAFFYREDLRVKYGVPEITDLDSIGVYLQAIKDNEPGMLPSNDYQAQVYGTSFITTSKYQIVDNMNDRHSNFVIDPKNPGTVLATLNTPEYLPFMHRMKEWADAGYWSRSVLSSTDWGVFEVTNGVAAASFNGQFNNYAYLVPQTNGENEGWDMNYFMYSDANPDEAVITSDPTGDMLSITRNAANPERALMLIDLVHKDQELFNLMNYGIEGVHYANVNNTRDESILADPMTDRFNYFPGALFDDERLFMPLSNQWEKEAEMVARLNEREQPDVLGGFVLDITPVEAEYTALEQVRFELGLPLQAGLVDDVDAAYAEFKQRSEDAGLETIRLEIERQINEFLASKG